MVWLCVCVCVWYISGRPGFALIEVDVACEYMYMSVWCCDW